MPVEQFTNNASTTLNGAITSGASSLVVTSATLFPTSGNFRLLIGSEIIIVGAVSGTTFSSLTRGAEGTTAAAHSNGDTVTAILTKSSIREVLAPVGYPNLSLPAIGSVTWDNQGSTTLTDNGKSWYMYKPGTGNSFSMSFVYWSAPATPWTVTMCARHNLLSKKWLAYGLFFSDGTKYAGMNVMNFDTINLCLRAAKFSSTTAYTADYSGAVIYAGDVPKWLRINDDGTNRTISYSHNGINFIAFHSIGRTDFLTPTRYAIGLNSQNDVTPNLDAGVDILSLVQS